MYPIRKYHKGLKQNGYKVVQRKFSNKKKRTCYNCGSTDHFVAKCPYEKTTRGTYEYKKRTKQMGEAHIGHEWDSTKESRDEDVKVATVAIQRSFSTPKLFFNMSNDDDHPSPHICLMANGEKVKTKSKSSPIPSDISSSELSESSSDDDLSDNDEFVQITRNLVPKTKIFITKLLEDLESVRAELATRDDDLLEQENMYIACKEALVLERSEVNSLTKVLNDEQREHAVDGIFTMIFDH